MNNDKQALDQLVNEWLDAKAALDKWGTIADEVAEQIIAKLGVGGRHEIMDGIGVRVQGPSNRFDPKKAAEVLDANQYAAICEAKPSATLAKKMLPGVLVEQLTTASGKPSVRAL